MSVLPTNWEAIRRVVLHDAYYRCAECKRAKATWVVRKVYEDGWGLDNLLALCEKCGRALAGKHRQRDSGPPSNVKALLSRLRPGLELAFSTTVPVKTGSLEVREQGKVTKVHANSVDVWTDRAPYRKTGMARINFADFASRRVEIVAKPDPFVDALSSTGILDRLTYPWAFDGLRVVGDLLPVKLYRAFDPHGKLPARFTPLRNAVGNTEAIRQATATELETIVREFKEAFNDPGKGGSNAVPIYYPYPSDS